MGISTILQSKNYTDGVGQRKAPVLKKAVEDDDTEQCLLPCFRIMMT